MSTRVAIEIGKQYLKIVIAAHQGLQTKLLDCIVEPITALSDDQIALRIQEIFRREKLKTKFVVVCLSRDSVTIRSLHLPSKDNQEINQIIDLHIARVVPYKKDEIVYTYQSLGQDEMGYSRVMLAIAHIDIVRRQDKILEKAGLFVDRINLSSYGIWQWALKNCGSEINNTELYVLLDFDSTFTDLIIFSKQNLFLTRGVNIGIKSIDEAKEAALTKLLGEVKQSLIIFYKEEMNRKVVKAFISGASIPDSYYKIIEADFGVPVRPVPQTAFQKLLNAKKALLPRDVSLSGISELILEENKQVISFILPEIQIRKSIREKIKDLMILGSLIVYIFTAVCAFFLLGIYNQQAYLRKLNLRFSQINKETADLVIHSRKIDFAKNYLSERKIPLIIIYQLQRILPNEIAISFLSVDDKNSITLRGQATELSDVFKFINGIEKSKYFNNVETKYTRKKKLKEKEITDFEVIFNLAS